MSADLEDPHEVLERLRRALATEAAPQAVVDALVPELRARYPLVRVTIRRLVDDVMLEIVGLWNLGPTSLGVGTKMTVISSSLPAIALSGKPVMRSWADATDQLLERIVRTEGIASFVTLPLRSRGVITGLLSLSSAEPDAFGEEDLPFLEQVAALVESHLEVTAQG